MATPLHQFEGKYEVLEKIAEGGMGAVYKVRHRLLDVIRVIKVMRPQIEAQEGTRARFLHEARLAIKMRHPNIAQLDDFSMDEDGNAFIVMEYIDGLTLQEYLQKLGALPPALSLEVARQSLLALGYLHSKRVIHRDISPDNLMLTKDESGDPLIKLIDLGIAKALQAESGLTATGMFVGKVRYASPEHFKTEDGAEIAQYSDLYSFGLVFYEMLTGLHPIVGESFSALIAGHLFRPPMEFAKSDPTGVVPEDLRQIVLKSIEKDPRDRYRTAKDFIKALDAVQERFLMSRTEFERLFRMTAEETPTLRIRRPGSTQDRINGEFPQGVTTPAPRVRSSSEIPLDQDLTGKTSELIEVEPKDARTEALLAAAQNLTELHLYDEAKMQLSSLLRLEPGNSEASELMARIEHDEKRARELASAIAEGRRLFDNGASDRALAHIEMAIKQYGPCEDLETLQNDIKKQQERARAEAVSSFVQAADELLAAKQFDAAIAKVEQALLLDPSGAGLRDLRVNIAEARINYEEEQRRIEQVQKLIGQADVLQKGGDHQKAVAKIREAHELKPDDHDLTIRLKNAEETMHIAENARQRAARLADVISKIDGLTLSESFSEARKVLEAARADLGDEDELGAAEKRIDRVESQWRAKNIERIQSSAQSLLAEGRIKEAIEKLETGLEIGPDNKDLVAQIKDLKKAREVAEKNQEINKVTADIEASITRADFATALQALDEAIKRFGKNKSFEVLRTQIKKAQSDADRHEKVRIKAAAAQAKAKKEAARISEKAAEKKAQEAAKEATKSIDEIATQPLQKAQRPDKPQPELQSKPVPEPKVQVEAARDRDPGKAAGQEKRGVSRELSKATSPKPVAATTKKGLPTKALLAAAICVAVITVVAFFVLRGGGPAKDPGLVPVQGVLIIDASPWAEVVSVVNEAGEEVALPDSPFTPLRLLLPVASYTITMTHPSIAAPIREKIDLVDEGVTTSHTEILSLSADDLLQKCGL